MHLPGPLRAELSKYRKRNSLSLGGQIPGIPSNHFHPGRGPLPHFPEVPGVPGAGGPRHFDEYDPIVARYQNAGSTYDTPDPWFDGFWVPRTPRLRFPRSFSPHGSQVRYDHSLITPELTEQALDAVSERVGAIPAPGLAHEWMDSNNPDIESLGPQARAMLEELSQQAAEARLHSEMLNTLNALSDGGAYDAQSRAGGASPPFESDPMDQTEPSDLDGLDQLVEQAMADMDGMPGIETHLYGSLEPADPTSGGATLEALVEQTLMQADPYQQMHQMYDDQLEMMLNPYMVPNAPMPGYGPMGPMPGPG